MSSAKSPRPSASVRPLTSAAELVALRALVSVVREGSVAAAAERLSVSQPAISNALAKLRDRCRDPLVVRVGNAVRFTPRAKVLAEHFGPVLEALPGLLSGGGRFLPSEHAGHVALGMPDYLEQLLAGPFLARLRGKAPLLTISFRRASAETAPDMIEDGGVDVALTRSGRVPDWLSSEVWLRERFVALYAPGTLPRRKVLSAQDLLRRDHVRVSFTGRGPSQLDEALALLGHERRVVATASTFAAVGALVRDSALVACVPHPIAAALCDQFGLLSAELGFPVAPIDVSLLRARLRENDPVLDLVESVLRDAVAETPGFVQG